MLRCGSVKRGPGGKVLARPEVLIPMSAEYPSPTWCLHCTQAYQCCYLILIYTCSCIDVVSTMGGIHQVNMGIDKAGEDSSAVQVCEFRVLATHATHLIVVAYCQNTPTRAIDSHRLRSWLRCIHCVDITVHIENRAHN